MKLSVRIPFIAAGIAIAAGLSARAEGFFAWFSNDRKAVLLKSALNDPDIQDGRAYTVHSDGSVNYWISRKDRRIAVDLPVMFDYQGSPHSRSQVFQRVPGIIQCVEEFYSTNGIKLSLRLTEGDPNAAHAYGYSYIHLWDSFDRNDAANWSVLQNVYGPMMQNQACAMWARETGQLLGLPERREADDPNDIMARVASDPHELDLSSADLAIILKPLFEH